MSESGEALKIEYSKLRRIFQDKKLSWKEIDELQHFIGVTVLNSRENDWEPVEPIFRGLLSNLKDIFEKTQYVRDIHHRVFPDGYDSDKHFFYFLNGHVKKHVYLVVEFLDQSLPR